MKQLKRKFEEVDEKLKYATEKSTLLTQVTNCFKTLSLTHFTLKKVSEQATVVEICVLGDESVDATICAKQDAIEFIKSRKALPYR